ncbi:glycosyltransferase family 4 protein [Janibacter cremeus]|uniref:glycosyltransferase family 4 protein n=1 Tax=Janibacter cremeus TaxID=1285192 RepID=UPI003D64C077
MAANAWDHDAPTGLSQRHFQLNRGGANPVSELVSVWSLRRALKARRGAILVAFGVKPVLYASFAAGGRRWSRRVAVITGLGVGFSGDMRPRFSILRRIQLLLYKITLPSYDHTVFQNSDDLELFSRLGILRAGREASVVHGSGVDTRSHFTPLPYPEGKVSFLFVGRFLRSKGLSELIEASSFLTRQGFDFSVELVGWHDGENPDGFEESQVARIIADSGAPISITGPLADVREALARSLVFVLPSYREGTSRSTIEAMASGRAVITTTAPGCRETIEDGQEGLLVEPRNVESLAQAMRHYILNPHLAHEHGRAARARAVSNFDAAKIADVWVAQTLAIE